MTATGRPPQAARSKARRSARPRPFWRSIREPLAQSRFVKNAARLPARRSALRFVRLTNPLVDGSSAILGGGLCGVRPGIIALWHGQHLLTPAYYPARQAAGRHGFAQRRCRAQCAGDREIRHRGGARFGRARKHAASRQGRRASALIALKKSLDAGKNVAMIADIPHGTPREAGLGIVTLARLSGRPILPVALATSRRKVLEKSWDKTTINLPFGRSLADRRRADLCAGRRRRRRMEAQAPGTDRRAQRRDRRGLPPRGRPR